MSALYGLILCGGRSLRMQQDKSQLDYHGLPQWQYLAQLLAPLTEKVYLSCREDQELETALEVIIDSVGDAGPATGILSAYKAFPERAWLVLACDLPLISAQSLELLIASRDRAREATAFISSFKQSPEPLMTIWEPAGLKRLDLERGCPRKTLLKADIALIENPFAIEQFNANTPAEREEAIKTIMDAQLPR
ncbi:NTP transferase domain-containing protein [Chitinophaga sancti]|uniref:Molybdopterin-guanine dinucleotide biosynthesis protein A n=1 Tax=Chitinophaga sancti TaxID=1004 RepID=A0A1K1SDX0_9BACT|nr:NTP transferase domain-containing protein [Chitinophaga sancti]WQD59977.1 NTP transferase domain-containing protein [Chitinophaga sancti]WQG87893.1 NTP transferase domain-containing protein [Chitinophaga sancti]SFW82584.1 molybdopterin-guanine dinucleotide biosynthesis protein A [Chitinophaga sancti]